MKNRNSILFISAFALAVLFTASVTEAAAGCCQLGRGGDGGNRSGDESAQSEIDWPFPFPFPLPKSGCYSTDNAETCEALGGTHYQLGVCAEGVCQPTAEIADAWTLNEPASCSTADEASTTISLD